MRPFDYDRASRIMRQESLDLVLAHTPHNVRYLTDYDAYTLGGAWLMPFDSSFLLEDGKAYYLMFVGIPCDESKGAFMTPVTAEEGCVVYHDPWIKDRRFLGPRFVVQGRDEQVKTRGDPVALVAEVLKEKGLDDASIGLETTYIPAEILKKLREALPRATFRAADPVLWKLRMIKSEEEISRMRKAARATEKALQVAFESARQGITELELVRILHRAALDEGALWAYTEMAFGPKGADSVTPTNRRLQDDEIVRIDAGGWYEGYYCDMSRVAVLGKPSEKAVRYHAAVLKTNEAVRASIKPGVKCSDLYRVAAETMRSENCTIVIPIVGHGVGRECHEHPFLSETNHAMLESGMEVNVEIAMRVKGVGSINIEDEVLVTKDGNELITTLERGLVTAG